MLPEAPFRPFGPPLSSHGVTNRYPIVLQFVFGVNVVCKRFARIRISERLCHVLTHKPGLSVEFHGAYLAELPASV